MAAGPVRAQGAQEEPGDDALPLPEGRHGAQEGQQGIGAGVHQVLVPEGAERHVLGALDRQGHAPGGLAGPEREGVILGADGPQAGLGVVGGQLAPDDLAVQAPGQESDAPVVAGQLQGEGLRHGDGLEEVLDAQEGVVAGPGRDDGQEGRGRPPAAGAQEDVQGAHTPGAPLRGFLVGGPDGPLSPDAFNVGVLVGSATFHKRYSLGVDGTPPAYWWASGGRAATR